MLAAGLGAISFGAILARVAQGEGVASLDIAAWPLGVAAVAVAPFALAGGLGALGQLPDRKFGLVFAAGAGLAGHFATWISSLEYTSVASLSASVTTNPLYLPPLPAGGFALPLGGIFLAARAEQKVGG